MELGHFEHEGATLSLSFDVSPCSTNSEVSVQSEHVTCSSLEDASEGLAETAEDALLSVFILVPGATLAISAALGVVGRARGRGRIES